MQRSHTKTMKKEMKSFHQSSDFVKIIALLQMIYFVFAGLFYVFNALAFVGYLEMFSFPMSEIVPTGHPLISLLLLIIYGLLVLVGIAGIFRHSLRLTLMYMWVMVLFSVIFSVVIFIHCLDYVNEQQHKYANTFSFIFSILMNAYGVGTSIASVYGLRDFRKHLNMFRSHVPTNKKKSTNHEHSNGNSNRKRKTSLKSIKTRK